MKQTLALLALAVGMSGCGVLQGVGGNTLMQVQKGMRPDEVAAILGQPMHRSFDRESEGWRYEKNIKGAPGITVIVLEFVDGKLALMDSYEKYVTPPVAVYPAVEAGAGRPSRPHVTVGVGMRESDFQAYYNKVKSKPLKSSRLALLEAGLGSRELSCRQCVRMMSMFRFDDDKLEALEILAPNISDRENYEEIIDSLDFISSEAKAKKILGIKK